MERDIKTIVNEFEAKTISIMQDCASSGLVNNSEIVYLKKFFIDILIKRERDLKYILYAKQPRSKKSPHCLCP